MASEPFKAKVARDAFRDGIAKIRKDYGKVEKRAGEKMAFRNDMPAPDQGDTPVKAGTEVRDPASTPVFAGIRSRRRKKSPWSSRRTASGEASPDVDYWDGEVQ